jgi:3'-phosphoadenosine 5'-phosphosulfate sulfotransferase (PAPS reductase)/FAD synthetase
MKGIYRKNSAAESRRKLKILKELQSCPLIEKIKIANKIIDKSLQLGKPAILYSGGRDSTVLLHLLLQHDRDILVIHNNTTLGDPALLEYVRGATSGLNYIETTAVEPVRMWKEKGYYPILSKRGFTAYKKRIPGLQVSAVQCCYQLKEMHANHVLKSQKIQVIFWGNRAGESNRRKFSFIDNGFLFKPKKYIWHQSYPLQHFIKQDIESYLKKNVPGFPLQKTFESGCLCCATDITYRDNNLTRLFHRDRELWEFYMANGFAKEIMRIKGYSNVTEKEICRVIKKAPEFLLCIKGKKNGQAKRK